MPAFLVECTIRRKNGTHPPMWPTAKYPDGKTYHFVPSATDERHLCEVDDMEHLARFASISEAYRIVEAPAPVLTAQTPATGTEGGEAGGGASLPNPDPNQTDPGQTASADDVELDPEDGLPVDVEQVRAIFEAEVGRKAHPTAKRETMVAQIKLAREAAAVAAAKTE